MDAFVGEIRIFGGTFAPIGWAACNGQLMSISENEVLYTLIGTTYGGDGQSTFALPDLRGRLPMHQGSGNVIGQFGGAEAVTLTSQTTPAHTHQLTAASSASSDSPANRVLAPNPNSSTLQFGGDEPVPYPPANITSAGSSLAHENRQPYLCMTFIIALEGIFPSQS